MHYRKPEEIIDSLLQKGKGILAIDESESTAGKRLALINLPNTEDYRRQYRELFLATPQIENYISGVILHEETFWQATSQQIPFTELLRNRHISIGIKVDEGLMNDPSSPDEELTKGIETLHSRLETFKEAGAEFAKWRMVTHIDDGLPTVENIVRNAKRLAEYASVCQNLELVPIIEPEVLMQGSHKMDDCERVSELVLHYVFLALSEAQVDTRRLLLKTGMILPGSLAGQTVSSQEIATATIRVLQNHVPKNVPGIAFLSGGQESIASTQNLQAICQTENLPWNMTFSFARALQESAIRRWQGKPELVEEARNEFLHRAKMNSLARQGQYHGEE